MESSDFQSQRHLEDRRAVVVDHRIAQLRTYPDIWHAAHWDRRNPGRVKRTKYSTQGPHFTGFRTDEIYWEYDDEDHCRDLSQPQQERIVLLRNLWRWHSYGWYHVHLSRQTCRVCTPTDDPAPAPLAATDTAILRCSPEIIRMIIELSHDVRDGRPWRLGRACRFWAEICLRRSPDGLYEDRLFGADDVMAFRALVSAPNSCLKQSVSRFDAVQYFLDKDSDKIPDPRYRRDEPWLHLLPATRRQLPNYKLGRDGFVSIVGPLRKGLRTMRSIHTYLPRSLPPSFSRGIHSLSLDSIQFRQFTDLQNVLDELPSLQTFEGINLSWPSCVPTLTRFPRHRSTDFRHTKVSLTGCSSHLEAIVLSASLHSDCPWFPPMCTMAAWLTPRTHSVVTSSIEVCVVPSQEAELRDVKGYQFGYSGNIRCNIIHNISSHYKTPLNTQPWVLQVSLPLVCLPSTSYPSGLLLQLSTNPPATYLNWMAFDEGMTTQSLRAGVIRFGVKQKIYSKQRYDAVSKICSLTPDDKWFITTHLPLLSAADRILMEVLPPPTRYVGLREFMSLEHDQPAGPALPDWYNETHWVGDCELERHRSKGYRQPPIPASEYA